MPDTQAAATPAAPKAAPNVDAMLDKILEGEGAQAPAAPETPLAPAPSWRDTVLDGEDVPANFRGKKAGDLFTSWQHGQEAVQRYQSERDRMAGELHQSQTRLTAQEAAQQAIRQMLAPPLEVPKEDPRYEQLNELMITDPKAFRELYDTIQEEKTQKLLESRLTSERTKIKQEIASEAAEQRRIEKEQHDRNVGRWAFEEARKALRGHGVTDQMMSDPVRVTSLYSAITLPSNPEAGIRNEYWEMGGSQNVEVIVKAWGDLFGFPHNAPAPPALPVVPPVAPITTPPGGAKPAAAVVPPPSKVGTTPMSRELTALMESAAEEMGRPKDRLIKRARGEA